MRASSLVRPTTLRKAATNDEKDAAGCCRQAGAESAADSRRLV